MMKKIFSLCLVLVLVLSALPASAASLIGGANSSAEPEGKVNILSVTCGTQNVTNVLTDGNMSTVHRMPTAYGSTLMISLGGATVSDIWVRNGDYSSADRYDYYDLAKTMRVTVYSIHNGKNVTTSYDYAMDQQYNPYGRDENWYSGYQRMALPQTFDQVTFISLMLINARGGYEVTNQTAVTDVMVTSGSNVINVPAPGGTAVRVPAVLKMRLATRTGPSTNYTEPGSFHSAGYELDVISQAYDERNRIWWVQVEFEYKGEKMRAYTGFKRVDVDLQNVPVEECLGRVWVTREVPNPWYGPGYNYRKHKNPVMNGELCDVYGRENGWLLVEYYDAPRDQYRRVWVPEEYTKW